MRHKKSVVTLDRKAGPRTALLRTLSISLILNGRITTTPAKARAVKRIVEPLVTRGKTKSVQTIRSIEQTLANKVAAMKVVTVWGPTMQNRPGGYTSMTKVANRKGDNAEQCVLEFVQQK